MQEKSSPNRIFFHNLRHLIHQSGLRDSQVAEAIGVHKGSLSRYFGEQRVPKKSVLNSLSSFFHVSVADLLNTDLTKVAGLTDSKDTEDDNSPSDEGELYWKRRALAAEERLMRLETILHELFAFAHIGQ